MSNYTPGLTPIDVVSRSLSPISEMLADNASVHVGQVANLPEALNMNEFRLVCQMNGLPVEDARQRAHSQREVQINPQYGLQLSRKSQKQINNFCDQLYSTYLALYNQFKKSHQAALQNNHVSPDQFKKHLHEQKVANRNPFNAPVVTEYTIDNQVNTDRHKQIIKELIELSQKTPGTLLNQYASAINGQKQQQLGVPIQPKYQSYSPIKIRTEISESSDTTPKDEIRMKSVRLEIVNTTNPTKFKRKAQNQAGANTTVAQPKKNQLLRVGLDQESIVREKQLEHERFNMINFKWSSDFREDKDLVQREEPEYIAQLRHKYIKRTLELEQTKAEMQKIKEIDLASRMDANREISQQRQVHDILAVLNKGKKQQMNKWFDIQIYDVTKGLKLDPDVQKALDTKIKTLTNTYEGKLKIYTAKCEVLEEQVALMNKVNSEYIKPHELTMEKLLELLAKIEEVRSKNARRIIESDPYTGQLQVTKRPPEIWKKFHECFGPDYFLECIEEEYGISPGSNDNISNQITKFFTQQVQSFKDQQTQMIKEKNLDVERYVRQLEEKDEEIAGLRRKQDLHREELYKKTKDDLHVYYQERELRIVEGLQREKIALNKQIEALNYQRDNQWRSQNAIIKIHALKRWQMFTLMRDFLNKDKECCQSRLCLYGEDQQNIPEIKRKCLRNTVDVEMCAKIESFMKEQCLMLRESKQGGMPVELHSTVKLINEIKEIRQEWAQDKFFLAYYKNANVLQQQTIQEMRLNIEDLNKKRDLLINSQPQVLIENQNLILCNNELTKQMQLQLNKIQMLEKRWASGAAVAQQLTVKNLMQAMEIKAANSFAEYAFTNSRAPKRGLAIPTKQFGMQTEICGLTNNIGYILEKTNMQKFAVTQTDNFKTEMFTQTWNVSAEATTQTPSQALTCDAEVQCFFIEQQREKLVEPLSPASSHKQNQGQVNNMRESIRHYVTNKVKAQKTFKAQVVKTFAIGSQGGMLSVGKMSHAISVPAQNPKSFQESQITKRLTKAKSKGVVLREKEVVSTNSPNSRQELSEMEDFEGNFSSVGLKKMNSNKQSFTRHEQNFKQSVHTNLRETKIFKGDKEKLTTDQKQLSTVVPDIFAEQKSSERHQEVKLKKKKSPSIVKEKLTFGDKGISSKVELKLAKNSSLKLLNTRHSSQRLLFKQNNLLKKSEILPQFEAAPTSRSPNKGENQSIKADSLKQNIEDICKIVGQQEESTSELADESQTILSSSLDQKEETNLKQLNSQQDQGSIIVHDEHFHFNLPLKKLQEKGLIGEKKLGTLAETRRSFSYQSKKSSTNRQIDNAVNADILKTKQLQAQIQRDELRESNRETTCRLNSARIMKEQDNQQFMLITERDQFPKTDRLPIQSIEFNRKDPLRMDKPLSCDQRALEALNESLLSFEFGKKPQIQQLLLRGLISEEQFIALQLLEKGALSNHNQHPFQGNMARVFSAQSYNTLHGKQRIPLSNTLYQEQQKHFKKFQSRQIKSTASQMTQPSITTNDFRSKQLMSPTDEEHTNTDSIDIKTFKLQNLEIKHHKILKIKKEKHQRSHIQLKVVPTSKIQVLEKIFDRVFKPKHDTGTQLDYQNTSFDRTFRPKSNAETMDMINLKGISNLPKKKRNFKINKFNDIRSKSQKDFNELPAVHSSRQLY